MFWRPGRGLLPMDSQVRRPITRLCPIVVALKNFISAEMCQGISPSRPMAQSSATATIMLMVGSEVFIPEIFLIYYTATGALMAGQGS